MAKFGAKTEGIPWVWLLLRKMSNMIKYVMELVQILNMKMVMTVDYIVYSLLELRILLIANCMDQNGSSWATLCTGLKVCGLLLVWAANCVGRQVRGTHTNVRATLSARAANARSSERVTLPCTSLALALQCPGNETTVPHVWVMWTAIARHVKGQDTMLLKKVS